MICKPCAKRADAEGGCRLDPESTCKARCVCQHRGGVRPVDTPLIPAKRKKGKRR